MKILNKLNLLFSKTSSSRLVAILLILIGAGSLLAGATTISGESTVPSPKSAQQEVGLWNVHLYAIPGNDATTLIGGVENTQNICEKIFFNAKLLGWELTPFEGERIDEDFHLLSSSLSKRTSFEGERVGEDTFLGTTPGFFPGCGEPVCDEIRDGEIEVMCELQDGELLISPNIRFLRYYIPPDEERRIVSSDNVAELISFPSLDIGRYVIVMTTGSEPGGPPPGVEFVSEPYSFRAAGLIPSSQENMGITLHYSSDRLGQADPLTLRLFEWDANQKKWLNTGEQNNFGTEASGFITKAGKSFTTYILGSTPLWCDSFVDDLKTSRGIDRTSVKNVLIDPLQDAGKLHLANTPGAGEAISQLFTPALDIEAWQTISYTANIAPGSQLTVSVLSAGKTVLLPAVDSGDSLTGINPLDHPGLRLKVEMFTTSGESPELLEWCILAKPKVNGVYLPLVIK